MDQDTALPIVCSLAPNELGDRRAEFDDLFSHHLLSVTQPEATRARLLLRAGEGIEAAVRDLLAREQLCCAFFTFHVERVGDALVVEASVPSGAEAALEELTSIARRAAAI
jgi:hypothetical protein